MTPFNILTLAGVIFLFLAAFNINFPRIASGWFGLALIYLALVLPGFGLSLNALLLVLVILLIVIAIILLSDRLRRRPGD